MCRKAMKDLEPGFLAWGRETCGDLAAAERREWLCTNGIGGFASGTVAGTLTRRYHGLLVAALRPPLGRTLVAAQIHETVSYDGRSWPLFTARWAGDVVDPQGHREIEGFHLDGTTPVWTYGCGDAQLEKRVWMEPGANTTYVRYESRRARGGLTLTLKALINYRDYHATTRAGDWRMDVASVHGGVRVTAFDGAVPVWVLASAGEATLAHTWYAGALLGRERDRGLDCTDDQLHVATFHVCLQPGESVTLVLSTEPAADVEAGAAWERRRCAADAAVAGWTAAQPDSAQAPAWIRHLALAADQFIARRPLADDPEGQTVIAGYPWFGDWGRDTMIALPGLTLTTGRPEVARRILTTFARFVDRGMLPNRFPDGHEPPEYNTVDATLWYFEAIRAYHEATSDDGTLKQLFPVLENIVAWHRDGTRYRIHVDGDGLLMSGEAGVQLTWMDAKVGDWVVTPRTGKAVEINALWYNALRSMAMFARRLHRPPEPWDALADRVRRGFDRFWSSGHGRCFDVINTPFGDDASLRPNQIFAVSLPHSPLSRERRRAVVDACARSLVTSYGLRSLAPDDPQYCGRYGGDQWSRDSAYHQGTVWAWLLGPFAIAHARVYGDVQAARSFLAPVGDHLRDHGLGSIAEIFDGDAPFAPNGCVAQAWSVAEVLRAWHEIPRVAMDAPSRPAPVS
jgi:predicted glycogen debranching enzyme